MLPCELTQRRVIGERTTGSVHVLMSSLKWAVTSSHFPLACSQPGDTSILRGPGTWMAISRAYLGGKEGAPAVSEEEKRTLGNVQRMFLHHNQDFCPLL